MRRTKRYAVVVTDALGSQLGRFVVTTRALALSAAMLVSMLTVALGAAVHGAVLHRQGRQTSELAKGNAELSRMCADLALQGNKLGWVVQENNRLLTLLARKSHVTLDLPDEAATLHGVGDGALPGAEGGMVQLDGLMSSGLKLETTLNDLLDYWRDAEQRLTYTPSIRPARTAFATSSYGVRIDPVFHYWVMHKGLDLGGFVGMLVYAPADGIVIWTGARGGYGQVVVIDHGMGLQTHYAHLSQYLVHRGEMVHRGDPIAKMGSTGKSTGPHLHYEVRQDGVPMDPRRFILD